MAHCYNYHNSCDNELLSYMGAKCSQPIHFLQSRLTGAQLSEVDCISSFGHHIAYHFACFFLPHPAGGFAASRVGPKIVLDHVRMYIYIYIMFVRFGFPHHWLYTMLLATHLRRGLRGLRNSNRASRHACHSCMPSNQVRLNPNLLTTPFSV